MPSPTATAHDVARENAVPIDAGQVWLDHLVKAIGNAHLVLLGEATHGTHEFYALRAQITQRLVAQHGFRIIAVEADWPDAYRVNRYVRGRSSDASAEHALSDFTRFPRWMWRNGEILLLLDWLRDWNAERDPEDHAGFYGLDLYSLHHSMHAVIDYLATVDPEEAARARERYGCFDELGNDPQMYGYSTSAGLSSGCEDEVVSQLVELRQRAWQYLSRDGLVASDEQFSAEQNARLAKNAEAYYRQMYQGRHSTWNLRDQHMAETLESLLEHRRRQSGDARAVVWEHNSHLGDARATSMSRRGEHNVGQLVRQKHGGDSYLLGFTTYHGTVSAASEWDGAVERKRVRDARPDSYEHLLHETGLGDFLVTFGRNARLIRVLEGPLLERAIGVIYRPETELASHYFQARLSAQFDAVIHVDLSTALRPLERSPVWDDSELPETYPFGV